MSVAQYRASASAPGVLSSVYCVCLEVLLHSIVVIAAGCFGFSNTAVSQVSYPRSAASVLSPYSAISPHKL